MTAAEHDPVDPPYSLDNALRWAESFRPGSAASVLAAEVRRLRAEHEDDSTMNQLRRGIVPDPFAAPLSDPAFDKLVQDVIAAHDADADVDDAHYELVMPFNVVQSRGGPFDDAAYCAGWEAGTIDVKLMALSAFGQSTTDLLCVEANWPQVSLILMKHGWNVDESSMSIADGWVSVKVVGF